MKELNTHFNPLGHRKIDERNLKFNEDIGHYINVPPDDGNPITFEWHFQRGMLSKEMTGLELGTFVLNHMQGIISMGLMKGHPRVEQEFEALFIKLALSPKEAIDQLLSWIKVKYREQEDDIIYMSLFDKTPIRDKKIISLPS